MNRTVKILLRWSMNLPTGRFQRGHSFSRPARFKDQGDDWTQNAWSLVINTEGVPDAEGEQLANVKFLVADAPHDWLSIGKRFTLYEGSLALAEGVVKEILPS
jgi:hypothetical protein